jgi:hypothetical protein
MKLSLFGSKLCKLNIVTSHIEPLSGRHAYREFPTVKPNLKNIDRWQYFVTQWMVIHGAAFIQTEMENIVLRIDKYFRYVGGYIEE